MCTMCDVRETKQHYDGFAKQHTLTQSIYIYLGFRIMSHGLMSHYYLLPIIKP